jgi:hypothetical protein
MHTFTLTDEEHTTLLLALGAAIACAFSQDNQPHGYQIVRLANRINEGNPDYTPYHIPEPF